MSTFLTIIERVVRGFTALPTHFDRSLAISIGAYILFGLAYGWQSGFLEFTRSSKNQIIRIVVTSFVAPALLEETFFRVLLLPDPKTDISANKFFLWSAIALLLFIIYHPLNALTAFPQGRKTFFDRRFLILATALGIVCTITYWQTASIWLPILIHWVTVSIWLLCLGGLDKLGLNFPEENANLE